MNFRLFNENILEIQYFLRAGMLSILTIQAFTLSKSINKKGNRILAIFLSLMLCILLNDNEIFALFGLNEPKLLNFILETPLLLIPGFSYLAILFYIDPMTRIDKKVLLLFTPWLADLLISTPFRFIDNIQEKYFVMTILRKVYITIVEPLLIAYAFVLWHKGYKLLKTHANNIRQIHSNIEMVDLRWLLNVATCVPLLILLHLLKSIIGMSLIYDIADIAYFIVIIYIGINLIRQNEIFPQYLNISNTTTSTKEALSEKNQKPNADNDKNIIALEELMQNQKPYLNPNLNLGDLAFMLEMRPQDLSQLLGNNLSTNFYSYINKYRVVQCKAMLKDPAYSNYSMEGIAKEAGFKSKSTFYARFKEFTGQTPLQYIQSE